MLLAMLLSSHRGVRIRRGQVGVEARTAEVSDVNSTVWTPAVTAEMLGSSRARVHGAGGRLSWRWVWLMQSPLPPNI